VSAPLPDWADAWAPGVTCCGDPAVRCQAAGYPAVTVCAVSGWTVEKCAQHREADDG
jgi:hypothetical protein